MSSRTPRTVCRPDLPEMTPERLRALVEATSDWIWEVDENGRYTFSSSKSLDLLGYEPHEILGRTPFDLMPPEDARRCGEFFAGMVASRSEIICFENTNLHKDGRRVVLETSAVPLFDSNGRFCGYRGIDRDITRRKEVEVALQQAKAQAEESSRAKDAFLAQLSHELRTPLSPILGVVNALEESPALPADLREYVEIVKRNVEMEARLVDDLLDVGRIARGKIELRLAPLEVHEQLKHVLNMCQQEIAGKQLRLETVLAAAHSWVQADVTRFHQVLWNLIRNAAKFTPAGGAITVSTANPSASDISITVKDTGMGIAPDVLPTIFNAFEQGGREITRQFGGLGLGLAISKALMELHGGRITAASEGLGRGATFVVDFPTIVPPVAMREVKAPATPLCRQCRILLVDDNSDTLRVLVLLLQRHGHTVQTATTVAQALMAAKHHEFDLLISDIGLPDGSGGDLMRQLRTQGLRRGIALSGFGMETDIQNSFAAGFSAHLTKPVDFKLLAEQIEAVMAAP